MSETTTTEEYVKEGKVYKRTFTQTLSDISLTELENMKTELELRKVQEQSKLSAINQTIINIDESISKIDSVLETTSG